MDLLPYGLIQYAIFPYLTDALVVKLALETKCNEHVDYALRQYHRVVQSKKCKLNLLRQIDDYHSGRSSVCPYTKIEFKLYPGPFQPSGYQDRIILEDDLNASKISAKGKNRRRYDAPRNAPINRRR